MNQNLSKKAQLINDTIIIYLSQKLKTLQQAINYENEDERIDYFEEIGVVEDVIQQLLMCEDNQKRCGLAACQHCRNASNDSLESAAIVKSKRLKLGRPLAVHFVHPKWSQLIGELDEFDFLLVKLEIEDRLIKMASDIRKLYVVGSYDVSHNIRFKVKAVKDPYYWPKEEQWNEHWQPHFHFCVWGLSKKEIRKALTPMFKDDCLPKNSKPLVIKKVKKGEFKTKLHYVIKNNYSRRVSYPKWTGLAPIDLPLKVPQFKELWFYFLKYPEIETLFCFGFPHLNFDDTVSDDYFDNSQ